MKTKIPEPFIESITQILFETTNNPEEVSLHFWKEILQIKKEDKEDFEEMINNCKIHTAGNLVLIEVKELLNKLKEKVK